MIWRRKNQEASSFPEELVDFPDMDSQPVNDFAVDGILSMCYVGLFPFGKHGDPTSKTRMRPVTEKGGFKHLLWFTSMDPDGVTYYPFAEHAGFPAWAYSRQQRTSVTGRSRVFLKQSDTDRALSMKDLKTMLESQPDGADASMHRMSFWTANITGTDAYWFKERGNLASVFEQKKPGTISYTFSAADYHWPDLHRLMPGPSNTSKNRAQSLHSNPHIANHWFGLRLKAFTRHFIQNTLGSEWHWYRFEWQSRASIHAHGTARLKNDPNLIELTAKAYKGRLASAILEGNVNLPEDDAASFKKVFHEGRDAEEIVCR